MPRLTLIRDFMRPRQREHIEIPCGARVRDFVPKDFPLEHVWSIYNGRRIHEPGFVDRCILLHDYEEVILRAVPGDLVTLGLFIGAVLLSVGLNFAVKALTPKVRLENEPLYDNTERSPTYSWGGMQNTTRNGSPIALPFGMHRAAGQVLSQYISEEKDKSPLYALIGVGGGRLGAINGYTESTDTTSPNVGVGLKINQNDGSVYSGMRVSYRMGDETQAIIPGFEDVSQSYDDGTEIPYDASETSPSGAYTYTTHDEVHEIDLQVVFGNGFYRVDETGAFRPYAIEVRAQYRVYGTASWSSAIVMSLDEMQRGRWTHLETISSLSYAKYEVRIWRTTNIDSSFSDGIIRQSVCTLGRVNEIVYDDVTYKEIGLVGIQQIANEQLHGNMPTITSIVHGLECYVYAPGDDFGEDTQQNFIEIYSTGDDKKLLWGWYGRTLEKFTQAQTHLIVPSACVMRHSTATADIADTSNDKAPILYKWIYESIDVRVHIEEISSLAVGDGFGLFIEQWNSIYVFAWVGIYNDSGTIKWRVWDYFGESGAEYSGAAAAGERYFRIVRTSTAYTLYTSTNGTDWTSRKSNTKSLWRDINLHKIGIGLYSDTATTGALTVKATDFEFADSTSYSIETTNNPAWVVYFLLTNTKWGIGRWIDPSKVDLTSLKDFAAYCNEQVANGKGAFHRRFCYDGILDAPAAAWEMLNKILDLYRATLLKQGDTIRVAWLRPMTRGQTFSMSNIRRDSFKGTYQSPEINANFWEVQYLNRDKDWAQDYEPFLDPDKPQAEPFRPVTLPAYGITRTAEALRLANYKCKWNRYMTNAIEFETDIEGVTTEPNDRFEFAHEVPDIGDSGRVTSATSTTVTLDHPVTLEENKTYQVLIRHNADDTSEVQNVTDGPGTYKTLTVNSWTTTPAADDLWVFGETDILVKPYICTDIKIAKDFTCTIQGIQYSEDLFDDAVDRIPVVTYTQLPDPRRIPSADIEFEIAERAQVMKDGSIQIVIDVTWQRIAMAASYDIHYREHGYNAWIYAGSSKSTHFVIQGNIRHDVAYDVTVIPVGPWGAKRSPDETPYLTITIQGQTARPPNVSSIELTRVGEVLYLQWSAVTAPDLLGYVLRYSETNDWQGATHLAGPLQVTEYVTTNFAPGTLYFLVKAVNRSGIYSETAAYVQETVDDRIDANLLIERNERSLSWPGTKSNMSTNSAGELVLNVGQTTGTYTTPVIDATSSVRALVSCQIVAAQITEGLTWADATFTWGSATAAATTWSDDPEGGQISVLTEIRYGDVTPTGDYSVFVPGEIKAQYYQFRVTVTVPSTSYRAYLAQMITQIDPPDIFESGNNVAIAATGTTSINFSGFTVTPSFTCVPYGGSAGDTVDIVSLSASSASVRYYDSTPTQVAGYVNWQAQGY